MLQTDAEYARLSFALASEVNHEAHLNAVNPLYWFITLSGSHRCVDRANGASPIRWNARQLVNKGTAADKAERGCGCGGQRQNLRAPGGIAPGRVYQPLNQEYDPVTDRWRERAPLPRALNHAGATGLNGKIYVVGAFTSEGHGGPWDAAFEYDPATDTWRALAPLKSPRGSVGVTTLGGKIHAIGGRGPDKVTVGNHEVYDPATGKWSELAPLPKARDHLAVVAAGGRIHAIGGRLDGITENVDFHDIYNPATNTWENGSAHANGAKRCCARPLSEHDRGQRWRMPQ